MASLPSSPVDHPCPEYQTVQSMYSKLCTGLQINLLIPNLISGSVIDFTEREEILAEATERKRTEKLLGYVMKQLSANCCDRFNRFMDVMGRSSNCSFLAKKMKEHLAYYRSQVTTQPGDVSDQSTHLSSGVHEYTDYYHSPQLPRRNIPQSSRLTPPLTRRDQQGNHHERHPTHPAAGKYDAHKKDPAYQQKVDTMYFFTVTTAPGAQTTNTTAAITTATQNTTSPANASAITNSIITKPGASTKPPPPNTTKPSQATVREDTNTPVRSNMIPPTTTTTNSTPATTSTNTISSSTSTTAGITYNVVFSASSSPLTRRPVQPKTAEVHPPSVHSNDGTMSSSMTSQQTTADSRHTNGINRSPSPARTTHNSTTSLCRDGAPHRWVRSKRLGSGSFGKVYLYECQNSGQQRAVKEIDIHPELDEKEMKHLENDIHTLKTLRHHRIVVYHDIKQDHSSIKIFMEYMSGGSLRQLLVRHGPLEETITRRYTKQLLEGVEYLHNRKILHRDIKGANVLMDGKGENVKIADFGTSKTVQTMHKSQKVDVSTFTGTAFYIAPEIINRKPSTIKSDIWSVGCTVVEMLTAYPPFHDLDFVAVINLVAGGDPLSIDLPEHCCYEAHQFVMECLTKDVSNRPTASELLQHHFLSSSPLDSTDQHHSTTTTTTTTNGSSAVSNTMSSKKGSSRYDGIRPQTKLQTKRHTPAMLRESSRDQPTSPIIVDDKKINFVGTEVTKLDQSAQLNLMRSTSGQFPIDLPEAANFNSLQPFIEDIIDMVDVQKIAPSMVSRNLLTPEQYRYCYNRHILLPEKQQTLGFIVTTISEDCVEKFLQCLEKTGRSYQPHSELLAKIKTESATLNGDK
ncbi:uncharacterized protein [Dysidea avara]|uniref:uncharacterized protein isoform X2 n=1 Tax=Dysidea avara TaxID=196820 RepID=UPI003325FA76